MSSACVAVPKMIQYKEHQVVSLRIYNCGDGVLAYSVTIYNRSVLAYRAVLFCLFNGIVYKVHIP